MKTIIKNLSVLALTLFISMGGCVQKLTTVNIDFPTEAVLTTKDLTTTGNQAFGETVLNSELKEKLEKNNTSLDLLDELKLKSATILIDSAKAGENFDKVDNIEMLLSADGLPTITLASKNPIAKGSTSIELNVNNSDNLANYLKTTTYTYSIKGTNNAPLSPMKLRIKANWNIKASVK